MQTIIKCVSEALLAEQEAWQLYKLCAKLANEQGFKNIGLLFRAIAAAEAVHIANHSSALGENNKKENDSVITLPELPIEELLRIFITKELKESKSFYPGLLKVIKKQEQSMFKQVAELSLTWAMKSEKAHSKLLQKALNAVVLNKDMQESNFYFCRVCGMVETQLDPNGVCGVCGHENYFYKKIEL